MSRQHHLLTPGDPFPALEVATAGGLLHLPGDLAGSYAAVLVYRGSWCPYCNAQLAAFQRALPDLTEAGAQVVALSVDDEATTAAFVAKRGLTFPVGFGADAAVVSAATGAVVDPGRGFLQSTGFVLDPEGRVVVSVYSTGAIGRLLPDDVKGLVRHARSRAA